MDTASGVLVFAIVWCLAFLVLLPIRTETQDEAEDVVPGTPASAPRAFDLKRKLKAATLLAVVVWAGIAWAMSSGQHLSDWMPRWLTPPSERTGGGTGG